MEDDTRMAYKAKVYAMQQANINNRVSVIDRVGFFQMNLLKR